MIDPNSALVFHGGLSATFLSQVQDRKLTVLQRISPVWRRRLLFFALFIVLPGLLGGLRITSDLFNVGMMAGGFLALTLDGYAIPNSAILTALPRQRILTGTERSVGPQGVSFSDDSVTVAYKWHAIRKVRRLADGIAIATKSGTIVPVEFATLPDGISPAQLLAAVKAWRGAAPVVAA